MRGWSCLVVGLTMVMGVGCGEPTKEDAASDEAAFTQDGAFQAIIGKTFVSGHCGHRLTLSRAAGAPPRAGKFTYSHTPCEDGVPAVRDVTGTFKITGAAFGGALTDASLDLTTSTGARWSYDVEEAPDPGEDESLPPKGTPILNGDAAHGDRMIPEGFLD